MNFGSESFIGKCTAVQTVCNLAIMSINRRLNATVQNVLGPTVAINAHVDTRVQILHTVCITR